MLGAAMMRVAQAGVDDERRARVHAVVLVLLQGELQRGTVCTTGVLYQLVDEAIRLVDYIDDAC